MSVQFGLCNFDGKRVAPQDLDIVRPSLAAYGPDGETVICRQNLGILYRSFRTTAEPRDGLQPNVSRSGTVITWDGRLDTRDELIRELELPTLMGSPDVEVVAAAYERWGISSLGKLVGDWALSIWDPQTKSLLLAKDFIGSRPLYYSVERDQVKWCSVLDPLVLLAGRALRLEEEYIAGWLASFPAPELTPFVGLRSVPPSSFVRLTPTKYVIKRYWDFDPGKRIRYRTDSDYEEHFRTVFSESIRRRLNSVCPIVAELSGGMDSSSIVCLADLVLGGLTMPPKLETVSYYDDSEPNWDERPYVTSVEAQRRQSGYHINVCAREYFPLRWCDDRFPATPTALGPDEVSAQLGTCLVSSGARVMLSGTGGDEILGGVPTPLPELSDLFVKADFAQFLTRLKIWALEKRKPWLHVLWEVGRRFLPDLLAAKEQCAPSWLSTEFAKRHKEAMRGYESRLHLFGAAPSFQENLVSIESLRRQISCTVLPSMPPYERRYPYLDRNLIEFALAVPRVQLVRPGERRSLMRRALKGIVPSQVLNRKRKAYLIRAPLLEIAKKSVELEAMAREMLCASLGIVTSADYLAALSRFRRGEDVGLVFFMRIVRLESWLRRVMDPDRKLMRSDSRAWEGKNHLAMTPARVQSRILELPPRYFPRVLSTNERR